ncbi:MAG: amidohydrolase family protein [Gemmatimonadetes bacterium]|nr:amidohydrolase family protein [Gemmatimonadota bacterium]
MHPPDPPLHMRRLLLGLLVVPALGAQPRTISPTIRAYVSHDAPVIAIRDVRVLDGTTAPPREGQTVLIRGDRIAAVGASGSVAVPPEAQVIDGRGHTLIPGLVGLHDHMYYSSAAGGSMKMMLQSYPRLFLGAGVTTVRTAGSTDSYQELNTRAAIERGVIPGPTMFVTGPYLQGPGPGPGAMHPVDGPEDARRMVRYWAEEGVTWFKAYTQISRAALGAAIDEAHARGVRVTAHLCSVGYREAVALGIDNLEHGLFANTEFFRNKQPDVCPTAGDSAVFAQAGVENPDVQRTIQEMLARKVSLTSTLAVYETSTPSRVPRDQRVLDALMPEAAQAVGRWYDSAANAKDAVARDVLRKTMAFEVAYLRAGGLLAAGSDPCCLHVIAGYGDQRNYELLVEAGLSPVEAVAVMTRNGARVLGIDKDVGTVEAGKQADLVLLRGNLTESPTVIRNTVTVFRRGTGFDSRRLIESIKGQVGIK